MGDLDKLALITELLGAVDKDKEFTLSPQAARGLYDVLCQANDAAVLLREGGEKGE